MTYTSSVTHTSGLRTLRESKGISQYRVAKELGTSHSLVWKWENGVVRPNAANVYLLANLYGSTMEDVMRAVAATPKAGVDGE